MRLELVPVRSLSMRWSIRINGDKVQYLLVLPSAYIGVWHPRPYEVHSRKSGVLYSSVCGSFEEAEQWVLALALTGALGLTPE